MFSRPSVQFELKLPVVAPAPPSDGDYPPLLARKDALEIAVEQLAVGRGHFKPERIVPVAHNFACHVPRGTGYVRAGGLMSYGGDRKELFQRAAALVDRIFKGAKPADLPFEQPTRYLFMINLGVAKAMGLEIPPNLLAFADEVIG
jgi:hypothetical protein